MSFTDKKCFKTIQNEFNILFYVAYNKVCSEFLQFQAQNKDKHHSEKKPHRHFDQLY